jgi:two-component system, LytTR family, response regulator
MLTALLIDDEKNSRESLRKKLESHCPQVKILDECSNGQEGLLALAQYQPDIVFLDIEMPHMNGFTMLQKLPKIEFELIFTTAYNHYAIQAIRFSALDYLVKPIDIQELISAIKRVEEKKNQQPNTNQLDLLMNYLQLKKSVPSKMAVSTASGLEIVDIETVVCFEAVGNYTNIHFTTGSPLLSSKTLKEFEDLLPTETFFRIHNASLVNLSFIKKYDKSEGSQVILSNGMVLDVARRRKDELLQLISKRMFKI